MAAIARRRRGFGCGSGYAGRDADVRRPVADTPSRAARVPDVDLRPSRPTVRAPTAAAVVERPSTPERRAQARAAFRAGASIAALAERYAQPWPVVRKWVRGRS